MKAIKYYNQKIKENPKIGSVELMEGYAKKIIENNFCDGTPDEFDKATVFQLKTIYKKIHNLVMWTYSN